MESLIINNTKLSELCLNFHTCMPKFYMGVFNEINCYLGFRHVLEKTRKWKDLKLSMQVLMPKIKLGKVYLENVARINKELMILSQMISCSFPKSGKY